MPSLGSSQGHVKISSPFCKTNPGIVCRELRIFGATRSWPISLLPGEAPLDQTQEKERSSRSLFSRKRKPERCGDRHVFIKGSVSFQHGGREPRHYCITHSTQARLVPHRIAVGPSVPSLCFSNGRALQRGSAPLHHHHRFPLGPRGHLEGWDGLD